MFTEFAIRFKEVDFVNAVVHFGPNSYIPSILTLTLILTLTKSINVDIIITIDSYLDIYSKSGHLQHGILSSSLKTRQTFQKRPFFEIYDTVWL